MTGPLYHLGRFCARRHWLVIVLWVLLAVALGIAARTAGDATSDNVSLPGTGSTNAQDLLQDRIPAQAYVIGAAMFFVAMIIALGSEVFRSRRRRA